MKTLKFRPELIQIILNNSKYITWRLFDDKDLQIDDRLMLINSATLEQFTEAMIISVKEKTFAELNEEDYAGHEKFSSKKEMYKTYSEYYNCRVTEETALKVIEFKLI